MTTECYYNNKLNFMNKVEELGTIVLMKTRYKNDTDLYPKNMKNNIKKYKNILYHYYFFIKSFIFDKLYKK